MESLTENQAVEASSRHFEIFLGLRSLLKQHLHEQHLPSFYAEKLCISTGYLNEAVMKTVHMSTQQYIMNETVIQAKRALYTTDDTIQHISWKLGYDDAAYFTRIFTKIAACSPSDFRKRVKG
jgi:AraC-like DNA-binding protein